MNLPRAISGPALLLKQAQTVKTFCLYDILNEGFRGFIIADDRIILSTAECYKSDKNCMYNILRAEAELRAYAEIIKN